jgi:tetratricopeptide (TPR) repeat protein/O-antigen ligase
VASSKSKSSGGKKSGAAGGKSGAGAKGGPGKTPQRKTSQSRSAPAAAPAVRVMDGMSPSEKVVWIALHALVFLVPIAISNANWIPKILPGLDAFALPLTYDQFDIVKVFVMRACALAGLGAWTFDFFMRGGKIRRTKVDWLILIFLGWVLLTSFTSVHPPTAFFGKYRRFEGFWSFVTYAVVYFLTVQMADRPARIRSLAHTLVVSGTIVAGYGVMQYVGIDPISWVGPGQSLPFEFNRGFSTYGNPDLLGGFLMFPLPIALAMALSDKRPLWRGVYWVVFAVTVWAWLTAFVRGAWIGGAVALVIMGVMAALAPVTWKAIDWTGAGFTVAPSIAVVVKSLTAKSEVLNVWARLQSIFKFGEGSALTRLEIWDAAIRAVKQRPLFGWGADTFRLVFPATKPLAYTRDAGYISVADNVHNYPLQLASALGVPGALLMYGLFGWVLWLGAPNAFARGKGPDRLLITGFWAAAVGYITHLMFGLSVTGSTVLLWLALAVIVAPTARVQEFRVQSWGPAVAVAAAALVTAASVFNVTYIVADRYYLASLFSQNFGSSGVDAAETAIRLNPTNDMYRTQLAEAYRQQMAGWLQEARTLKQQNTDTASAIEQAFTAFQKSEAAYRDVIAFVPTEYDNHVFLAALYNQAASYFGAEYYNKAVAAADVGIEVEPNGPFIRYQKAIALWNLGKVDEVIRVLEATVTMDPKFADPIALLGDAYARTGATAKGITTFEQLLVLRPDDQQAKRSLAALYLRAGRYDKAVESYKALLVASPEDAELKVQLRAAEASLALGASSGK